MSRLPLGSNGWRSAISGDGRLVALSGGIDSKHRWQDIVVVNRPAGTCVVATQGFHKEPPDNRSDAPSLTPDGRYVAFASDATNLVADDLNNAFDVFVTDLQSGVTEMVSRTRAGGQGTNAVMHSWWETSISADARFVAFNSSAPDLVAGSTNGKDQIVLATVDLPARQPETPAEP